MDTREQTRIGRDPDRDGDWDGDWGPPLDVGPEGRRRRRPWLRRLLTLVLVVLLVVVGWAGALAWHLDSSIERLDVSGRSARTGSRINVLVIGSDSRADLSEEERSTLRTGSAEGERTDSIMVLSVRGSEASLTSFPRDLWVTRCDGTDGRINAALGIDGPGCLVDTVESLGDIPIHHYVEVDFGGFSELVDAVGGVRICVDKALDDPLAGIDLQPGCQRMDGPTALGYVRTRKLDNDLERIKRQQQFLAALAGEVATPATVVNPVRAWSTTGAVGAAIRADRDLGIVEFARLGWGARAMAAGDLDTATVPGTPATINGADVLEPDLVAAEEVLAPLREDAGGVGDDAEEVALPDRDQVTVTVLNGGSISGAARSTAEALAALGYGTGDIDNADTTETTTIVVAPGGEAAAERVSRDLPVRPAVDASGTVGDRQVADGEVVIVLGNDLDPAGVGEDAGAAPEG